MELKSKIRILHLLSRFKGNYPLFNQIIEGLDHKRYHHIVLYMTETLSPDDVLNKAGYDIRCLPFKKKDLRHFRPSAVLKIREIIKSENIDIIHAHRHKPCVYAVLAAQALDTRVIVSVHGQNRWRSFGRRLTNRLLWSGLSRIIAISEAVRQDILAHNSWFPYEKISVIHNGIDTAYFSACSVEQKAARKQFGLPGNAWLWGTAGRLTPVKGHGTLLTAWAKMSLGAKSAHLAIAGEGELEKELKNLANRLKISEQVTFLGQVRDMPCFLNALDGFVFPSINEGLGLALIEAMSAGIPVVASDTGGIPEVLKGIEVKGHVFLTKPECPEELGRAMVSMMKWDQKRYNEASASVKKRGLEFDKSMMIDRMDKFYQEIADPRYRFIQR
jgi:glycosyltransferase involved in cell wall biosynthesis